MGDVSRREFVKLSSGVLAASGLSAPPTRPARAGANDTVVLAMIGVHGRAGGLMQGFASHEGFKIKTLVDVDSRFLPDAVARVEGRQGTRPGTVFGDFRKVLDDKDIDALIVGTPDHWHAIPTVFACQAGKHVYVEKPDGHDIREGRLMVAAARKYDRVVQMGIQSRSGAHFAEAIDYLRGGAIGRALYARAWESAKQGSIGRPADAPVPAGVDYDTWLGPAPKRPFNPMRFHGNWRWFFDYGTGDLGNDGVHRLDMARRGLPREKVLATVVHLLENTLIRVGNLDYAKQNKSYGLTTLRDKHVDVDGAKLRFVFKGKSGKSWNLQVKDRRIARIVKACQDVPGQHLFQYVDENGERHRVASTDVNSYLREISGRDITAKDFRTWAGTVLAAIALQEFELFDTNAKAKKNVRAAIEKVSARLGNTPTICRKCYIHPEVLNCYLEGALLEGIQQEVEAELRDELASLKPEEAAVLTLLQRRLAENSPAEKLSTRGQFEASAALLQETG